MIVQSGSLENLLRVILSSRVELEISHVSTWQSPFRDLGVTLEGSKYTNLMNKLTRWRNRGPGGPGPPFWWNIFKRSIRKRLKWAFKSHFKGIWAPSFQNFMNYSFWAPSFKNFWIRPCQWINIPDKLQFLGIPAVVHLPQSFTVPQLGEVLLNECINTLRFPALEWTC